MLLMFLGLSSPKFKLIFVQFISNLYFLSQLCMNLYYLIIDFWFSSYCSLLQQVFIIIYCALGIVERALCQAVNVVDTISL